MEEYRSFNTPEEVKEWVNNNYSIAELSDLSFNISNPENNVSLFLYKGVGYKRMNENVRKGNLTNEWVAELQKLLLSKRIKESIEVERFVDFKEWIILVRKTRRRRVFEYPAFLSTTMLSKDYGIDDIACRRHIIKIQIPQGTPGTYIPEVNKDRPEFEILMPHHIRLCRIKDDVFRVVI